MQKGHIAGNPCQPTLPVEENKKHHCHGFPTMEGTMFNYSKLVAGLAHKMGLQMRTWKFHYVSNIISFFFFWLIFTNSFKSIILDFEKDSWKFNFTN